MRIAPISVVIPCYRCAEVIDRALASIVNQTLQPSEIILVDDASGDGTLDILESIKNKCGELIHIVKLPANLGAASARNAGWDFARQTYIAFLDADDTWPPDKLQIQFDYMSKNPSVALCGNVCMPQIDCNSSTLLTARRVSSMQLLFKNHFSTPTVMLRREIPFRFLSGKRYAEDWLLWQEMAFSGLRLMHLSCPLAHVHKPLYGAGGLSSKMWQMEIGELDNMLLLRRSGQITILLMLLASGFSLAKYGRRLMIHWARSASKKLWHPV